MSTTAGAFLALLIGLAGAACGPVSGSDGSTEYEFREGEDHYATWVVAQDEDGRFGVISLSGCSPATR